MKTVEPPHGLARIAVALATAAAGVGAGVAFVPLGFVAAGACNAEGFACLGWLFAGAFAACAAFGSAVTTVAVYDGSVSDADLDALSASLERRAARWLAAQESWLYRVLY